MFRHCYLWCELNGNCGNVAKVGLILLLLIVSTSSPRRSVWWLSGHLALGCLFLSCGTSGMEEWVNIAASCATGAGERTVSIYEDGGWHGKLRRRARNFGRRTMCRHRCFPKSLPPARIGVCLQQLPAACGRTSASQPWRRPTVARAKCEVAVLPVVGGVRAGARVI